MACCLRGFLCAAGSFEQHEIPEDWSFSLSGRLSCLLSISFSPAAVGGVLANQQHGRDGEYGFQAASDMCSVSIECAIPMDLGNPMALGYTLFPLENDGQPAGDEAQSRIEPIQWCSGAHRAPAHAECQSSTRCRHQCQEFYWRQ